MCGICGVVHLNPAAGIDQADLLAMRDAMIHRGPDDAGCFVAPGVALGSRRLSILDLTERGRMPMSTADGRYHIVYNGEAYNSPELRHHLQCKGYSFRSRTDTEVILYLYADEGPKMLDRLNGMFAIAVWDARDRTLFLARDRLGVKPLYYVHRNGSFHFASEQKALFASGVPAEFDVETLQELLCFRYIAGDRTPFVDVRRLLPGHYLLWRDGQVQIRRWWNLAERAGAIQSRQPGQGRVWFRETFDDAVELRRLSDVPVGVLLSGGLDSGSVAASLASRSAGGVESFTVTFEETEYNEGPIARQIADRWNLNSHELKVGRSELLPRLLDSLWLNDEPLVHGNELHIRAISEYAKPIVTVLLSGEGGDETLGGYVRYQPLRFPHLLRLARPLISGLSTRRLPRRAGKLGRLFQLGSPDALVLFNACDVLPGDLAAVGLPGTTHFAHRESMLAEAKTLYPRDLVRQAMYLDQHTFLCSLLDRNDRMTMGASIECRVPFLDYRLVEGVAAMPTTSLMGLLRGKALLRDSVGDRLPRSVLRQRKWGFGVPWSRYLRDIPELREAVLAVPSSPPISDGLLDRRRLERIVHAFLLGDPHNQALVQQLVMLSLWYQVCVRNAPRPRRVADLDHARLEPVSTAGPVVQAGAAAGTGMPHACSHYQ
jgi:asparagine synthase (glutamine-hydrolysing)